MNKTVAVIVGILSFVLILLGGTIGVLLASKPHFPKSALVKGLSLKSSVKYHPPSALLRTMMKAPNKHYASSTYVENWRKLLVNSRGWFKTSKLAIAEKKAAQSLQSYQLIKKTLAKKGCPPPYDYKAAIPLRYVAILRAIKLVGLHNLLKAQKGNPDEAAKEMIWVAQSLQRQVQHCEGSLLYVMVWLAAYGNALKYIRYTLSHPTLSSNVRNDILRALLKLENPTVNPTADMLLSELSFQLHAVRNFHKGTAGYPTPALMYWPWWDRKQTEMAVKFYMAPKIHRATLPLGPKFWAQSSEEKFIQGVVKKFVSKGKYISLLQYNASGLRLVAIASPSIQKYVLKWHQYRCVTAATRAWGIQQARLLKQEVPKELVSPTNPLTGKPLGDLTKAICEVIHPKTKQEVLSGRDIEVKSFPKPQPKE